VSGCRREVGGGELGTRPYTTSPPGPTLVVRCRKGEGASATRGWHIKYYKGLGTSTAVEAKAYFSDLPTHQIDFAMDDPAVTGYNAREWEPGGGAQ